MSLMIVHVLDRPDLLRDTTVQPRGPEDSSQACTSVKDSGVMN